LVTTLVGSGIWLDLDRPKTGVLVGAAFIALTLARRFAGGRFVLEPPPRAGALRTGAAALVAVVPIALYLAATWREEFPFLGDHDYHLGTSWAALDFWSKWAPWVAPGLALATAASLFARPRFWPLAASPCCSAPAFFLRDAAVVRPLSIDAPFNQLFRWGCHASKPFRLPEARSKSSRCAVVEASANTASRLVRETEE